MALPKIIQKIINNVGYGQALTGNDNDVVHKTGEEVIEGTKIFSSTISGSIDGNADSTSKLSPQNRIALPTTNLPVDGLQMVEVYNNDGYPTTYGNVINVQGTQARGAGQLLLGWSNVDNGIENIYYRNKRDTSPTWSNWKTLAFTDGDITGNAKTATTLATNRTINDTNFNGSANITTTKWGTARNISISDSDGTNVGSAVSVNGSGNATLKLPATIKASITGNCSGNAETATKIQRSSDATSYVGAATVGNSLVNSTATNFGSVFNAPTKNYRVALATYPGSNDNVLLYSVSNDNIASGTNTTTKILAWGADNGTLSANTFLGNLSGNASSSTKLKTSRKIDAASFDGTSDIVVVPIGAIIYYAGTGTPENYLLCNGAAVSRTTYAALFSVIGTTYGAGDGSTTFNLPDLMDRFPHGSYTPGTKVNSGLPNITGTFRSGPTDNSYWVGINSAFGAFEAIDWASYHPAQGGMAAYGGSSTDGYTYCKLDASRSSSIYGASTVVQPPALTLRPIIKAL